LLIVALPAPAYKWIVTTDLLVTQGERCRPVKSSQHIPGAFNQIQKIDQWGQAAMLTITPTAMMDRVPTEGPEVFAVIGGKKVFLPVDARYVMQDRRGIWYYSSRKPRPKEGDWTPNKTSIACLTERGYVRALKTDTVQQWEETCQRTVRMMRAKSGGNRRPLED